jgi:hypothetical protein
MCVCQRERPLTAWDAAIGWTELWAQEDTVAKPGSMTHEDDPCKGIGGWDNRPEEFKNF